MAPKKWRWNKDEAKDAGFSIHNFFHVLPKASPPPPPPGPGRPKKNEKRGRLAAVEALPVPLTPLPETFAPASDVLFTLPATGIPPPAKKAKGGPRKITTLAVTEVSTWVVSRAK